MKSIKFNQISIVNFALYALISLIALGILGGIISFTNDIFIHPKEYEKISLGSTGIPIMRPYNDVFFYIKPEALKDDESLHQKLQRNEFIFGRIHGLISGIVFIFFLLQLRKLIFSIKKREFYTIKSVVNVKNIAYLLCLGVFIDFMAYQTLQFAIPLSIIEERINYITLNEGFLSSLMFSIDITTLLIAFAFYVISVVFKDALLLKEQADLTV